MKSTFDGTTERLRAAGFEAARAEARILRQYARDTPASLLEELIRRRLNHEPMAYITGHKEFWSLDFAVGRGVLIPRPETETLVEQALRELPDRDAHYRVFDLGTGSGCLLIALLKEFQNASGVALDSSEPALSWAWQNVKRHGLEPRCELVQGEWGAAEGVFDLIVSNPPYVAAPELVVLAPDIRNYEPLVALDGGPDGLAAYRAIAPILLRHLSPLGVALLEIGAGQHHLVGRIMEAHGLSVTQTIPDLAGIGRCLAIRHQKP